MGRPPTRDVTPRQLAVIRVFLAVGGLKGAAYALGVSPFTVRNHLINARRRVGVETNEQLIYILSRRGSLKLPEPLRT